ncbi:MAG TPA: hypothetical protein VNZ52_16155 [Candidatus Thermoplasmatota archaeon]|nr:hypothetical protein [Candidatus Thermoplasmatota archaeon]
MRPRRVLPFLVLALSLTAPGCLRELAQDALGPYPEEAAYVAALQPHAEALRGEVEEGAATFRALERGSLSRAEALAEIRASERTLREEREAIAALSPPPRFEATHRHLLRGLDEALTALSEAEACLERMRPARCESAADHRAEALAEVTTARDSLPAEWRSVADALAP